MKKNSIKHYVNLKYRKRKNCIKEWEVLMQLEQEIQGRLEKEKEQNYIDKLKKECGHSLEINLQKKMDMNIPDHLLNPTGQVSIKDSENTITPSAGSSSKRTFGPISSSPAEKCVELQVPSPTSYLYSNWSWQGNAC